MIIKPSEFAPACADLLAEMIAATFPADLVDVAVGGLDLAREFASVRWDHLLYTGSPRVGREVAKAAAENLVPTTLELGGKTPAILLGDAIEPATVEHIVGIKMIKNGQMCNTVDHCLVPADQVDRFVELAEEWVAGAVPDYSRTEDCPGIIRDAHLDRVLGLIEEAREAGCRVVQLDKDGAVDRETRRVPMHIVVDPPAGIGIAEEEVFGPILPVHSYASLDAAIEKVNDGERPLGLYVFTADDAAGDDVLDPHLLRRGLRQRLRAAGGAALARLRRRRPERHRAPPRGRRLSRVHQPARCLPPRRGRSLRVLLPALRRAPAGAWSTGRYRGLGALRS